MSTMGVPVGFICNGLEPAQVHEVGDILVFEMSTMGVFVEAVCDLGRVSWHGGVSHFSPYQLSSSLQN
jgi:hypothetical protein